MWKWNTELRNTVKVKEKWMEIFKEKVKRNGWKLIFKMVKAYRSWHGHNTKREKITTGKNYEEKTWK